MDIATDYLKSRVGAIVANAENLPYREHFDVLAATDILEHVLRPGDFLLSAHRALKVGGRFMVRVPVFESLLQYAGLGGYPYELVHLRTYTPGLLRQELRGAGFKVTRMRRTDLGWGRMRRMVPVRLLNRLPGRWVLRIPRPLLYRSCTVTCTAVKLPAGAH